MHSWKENFKSRCETAANYSAIWFPSGKTYRFQIDPTKPILEIKYPEFLDVKITSYCEGNCTYCYQNSTTKDNHFHNIVERLGYYLNSIPVHSYPFQIAFGGGEPTSHPDFNKLIKFTYDNGICPNFTTNGLWTKWSNEKQQEHLNLVKKYCGGVAVSTHKHLKNYWSIAVEKYLENNIRTNLHIIISNKESIDQLWTLYEQYQNIEFFVLLPLIKQGRNNNEEELDWGYFVESFKKRYNQEITENQFKKIAFGAKFYPYLQNNDLKGVVNLSLYEPELMSKYLVLDRDEPILYPSSFNMNIK